ncbi:hypothetical protein DY000_02031745 [Brassica cretica]|uniref:Uncharacterized protein n=1 Tax=Brassica cretica TaxID=69181 RepID=A0ABQ7DZP8_BRACR|nr:hypothetical protein DY000_02031745 [Brassica cretica]
MYHDVRSDQTNKGGADKIGSNKQIERDRDVRSRQVTPEDQITVEERFQTEVGKQAEVNVIHTSVNRNRSHLAVIHTSMNVEIKWRSKFQRKLQPERVLDCNQTIRRSLLGRDGTRRSLLGRTAVPQGVYGSIPCDTAGCRTLGLLDQCQTWLNLRIAFFISRERLGQNTFLAGILLKKNI